MSVFLAAHFNLLDPCVNAWARQDGNHAPAPVVILAFPLEAADIGEYPASAARKEVRYCTAGVLGCLQGSLQKESVNPMRMDHVFAG